MTASVVTPGMGGSRYRLAGAGSAEDDDGVRVVDGPLPSGNMQPDAGTNNAINNAVNAARESP